MIKKLNRNLCLAGALCLCGLAIAQTNYDYSQLQREQLGRGLVAVRDSRDSVAISWRYLSSDPEDMACNVYRNGKLITKAPVSATTFFKEKFRDNGKAATYELRDAKDGKVMDTFTLPAKAPVGYINIPLNIPEAGVTPAGQEYTYTANDASIGDVDGDGIYEVILKWDPSNSHDNAHDGYSGNVYVDCYTLDGDQLWRIDLGKNIRAGAHYTQFMVYDLDGDGKAEVVMKTADGTVDGTGKVIGDADADWREKGDPTKPSGGDFPKGDPRGKPRPGDPLRNQGRILTGPEYLTVFSGETGEALATTKYIPPRGILSAWGDDRANRADRFLAAVAYLDGVHPSVVMCRGYYTRTVLAAYDWDGKNLTTRWVFDSDYPGFEAYGGQGNHNLRSIDVDGDGCDEIVYGQCTIDNDGRGLYSTGMYHGDAIHVTSMKPCDNSLQVWACHENRKDGSSFRDARTGEVIWQVKKAKDVGRCLAADIDPTNPGLEMWSSDPKSFEAEDGSGGVRNYKGEVINPDQKTLSINSAVWWDGDLCRELLDHNKVTKYNWEKGVAEPMAEFEGCSSNNGTKGNACLSGDILGDWREEVIMRTDDNSALRIYVSGIPTDYRFHTFLEDMPYRQGLTMQNVAYNQPPQVGFYFGSDFKPGMHVRGTTIK